MVGWGQAAHRNRAVERRLLPGERGADGRVSAQIMMQRGAMHQYEFTSQGFSRCSPQPWLARCVILSSTTADGLIEAIRRQMMLDVADEGLMTRLASRADYILVFFCTDMASNNFTALTTRTCRIP